MSTTLILGKVWPEPASSAAGTRMLQLMEFFLADGRQLWFGTPAAPTAFSGGLGNNISILNVELNSSSFDEQIRHLKPSLVVFDRFTTEEQFGWRVAEHCPEALRVLNGEDLHCLRAARETAIKENRPFTDADLFNETARREIASIYRCDLTLVISTAETEILRNIFKVDESLFFYLPFLYEQLGENTVRNWNPFAGRKHFVFVGNFLHAPNLDAMQFMKAQVWPLIRRSLPEAEMHVYGAYGEKHQAALHDPALGFLMKGRADNVSEVMRRARVCLAPLRFGAGMKGKLVEAMFSGTPSVTTTIGHEGMGNAASWPGAVANEPGEFARAAIRLHEDEQQWKQAQDKIRVCFNRIFNGISDQKRLKIKLDDLSARLREHRQRNFIGSMLNYQTQHASKWLSKYIELKNQPRTELEHEKKNDRQDRH